jgi:CubicO group peptidase (beta-lactamase class C family)
VILRLLLPPVLLGVCACSPGLDLEPLRVTAATSALASDLGVFVPDAMARAGVPGVSVAVVRDGAIVFSAGYGVADVLTRRPVTPRTVFEVASNSKPVVAYATLALVDTGVLALAREIAHRAIGGDHGSYWMEVPGTGLPSGAGR